MDFSKLTSQATELTIAVFLMVAISLGTSPLHAEKPLPNIDTAYKGLEQAVAPVIFREYLSPEGHWITEALVEDGRIRVTVYEMTDGILKQISSEIKTPPNPETIRVRGPNPLKEVFKKRAPAVVRVEKLGGLGSGIILSAEGLILTNRHVVRNAQYAVVAFYELRDDEGDLMRFPARVVAVDKVRDLALIEVQDPPKGLQVFPVDGTAEIGPGDELFAIGHPLGEQWTPTQGVVSAIREDYQWDYRFSRNIADVVQFQTPISPGNSGGPVMDADGNLVGISTFGKSGGQNLNFAVLTTEVEDFVKNRDDYPVEDVHDWRSVTAQRKQHFAQSGVKRAQECDFENDGNIDIIRFDQDGNGDWDHMLLDVNCDGVFEFIAMDLNEDGYFEALLLESNGDGEPDYVFRQIPNPMPVSVRYLRHDR